MKKETRQDISNFLHLLRNVCKESDSLTAAKSSAAVTDSSLGVQSLLESVCECGSCLHEQSSCSGAGDDDVAALDSEPVAVPIRPPAEWCLDICPKQWNNSNILKMKLVHLQRSQIEISCKDGTRRRYCNRQWLYKYIKLQQGPYYLPCALFPVVQSTRCRAQSLTSCPLTDWKDAVSILRVHSGLEYRHNVTH